MSNGATLKAAQEKKATEAAGRAQAVSKLQAALHNSSPLAYDHGALSSDHDTPLDFPDSDNLMAEPSDEENPSTGRQTRSLTKRKSGVISDSSDDDVVGLTKLAKKKPGPKKRKTKPSLEPESESQPSCLYLLSKVAMCAH
ncbi:hypothetical protein C8J57DRAFT_1514723 [Mycena rebaudengoi]|nr:hypothetical protein C8J57DRAFT_1514723 [Mycena rebaudengoi]